MKGQNSLKVQRESVTFRMAPQLRHILERIAQTERRSFSSQLNLAIEEWMEIKSQLHPQFIQDIKEALESGKSEPVWKGSSNR